MEVNEQTTDYNRPTVPGSLAGGIRGSAQQAWGKWLEAHPQQLQESRNNSQQAVSHTYNNWTTSDFQERLDDDQEEIGDTGEKDDALNRLEPGH